MNRNQIRSLCQAAAVAALYVLLTLLSAVFGLSGGAIQLRLSECLCVLPVFLPAAVPGLFLGCLVSNLLCGGIIWDVIFGSLATLLGAWGTRRLRKRPRLALLPPVLANTLIVPAVLAWAYHVEQGYWLLALTVGAGELLSCGVLGGLLYRPFYRAAVKLKLISPSSLEEC